MAIALNFSDETKHTERSEALFVDVLYKYYTHCVSRNFVAEEACELKTPTKHSFTDAPKITMHGAR